MIEDSFSLGCRRWSTFKLNFYQSIPQSFNHSFGIS